MNTMAPGTDSLPTPGDASAAPPDPAAAGAAGLPGTASGAPGTNPLGAANPLGATPGPRAGAPVSFERLTGQQKVAIVLAQLRTATSTALLKALGPEEAVLITTEIAKLPPLRRDVVDQVMEEFVGRVNTTRAIGQGGIAQARRMLAAVVGEAKAKEVMSNHEGNLAASSMALLTGTEPEQIVPQLADEHPQTVAVIVAHMPPAEGARLLDAMAPDLKAEVALRIATLGHVPAEAVSVAAAQLATKLRAAGVGSLTPGGVPALVDLLLRADGSTEKTVLAELEARDPELAEAVRSKLFTFEDVPTLDDRTLQTVLRSVEINDLAIALRAVPAETVEKFTRNLSERGQAQLSEEMQVMGAVRAQAVDAARSGIVRVVRDLEAEGTITIARGDEELI